MVKSSRALRERLRALAAGQKTPSGTWSPRLKYRPRAGEIVVVWSESRDIYKTRAACENIEKWLDWNFARVLVTPAPDVVFYARLGWLVEYLPSAFAKKKAAYLAARYADAVVIPVEAGLTSREEVMALLEACRPAPRQ